MKENVGLMFPKRTNRIKKHKVHAPSILQSKKECFVTGERMNLHRHHIFQGARRNMAEANGFWVWLSFDLHEGRTDSAHGRDGAALKLMLKQKCEYEFLKTHTMEAWMALVKKNYLLNEVDWEVAERWTCIF